MTKVFAAIAFAAATAAASLVAAPARAQSFDPSVGSGNIAQAPAEPDALGAYARHELQLRDDLSGRLVLPYTRQELEAIDRAKGDIW